jgi:hypothetical protein
VPRSLIVVDACLPTAIDDTNIRDDPWSIAMDQRAFGPRKLLVAFADADGTFRGLAFTARTKPIDDAFRACLAYIGAGAAAAIAYCDEPVSQGEPPPGSRQRFQRMRWIAVTYGVHLVDWISCDDEMFRTVRGHGIDVTTWWDVE